MRSSVAASSISADRDKCCNEHCDFGVGRYDGPCNKHLVTLIIFNRIQRYFPIKHVQGVKLHKMIGKIGEFQNWSNI